MHGQDSRGHSLPLQLQQLIQVLGSIVSLQTDPALPVTVPVAARIEMLVCAIVHVLEVAQDDVSQDDSVTHHDTSSCGIFLALIEMQYLHDQHHLVQGCIRAVRLLSALSISTESDPRRRIHHSSMTSSNSDFQSSTRALEKRESTQNLRSSSSSQTCMKQRTVIAQLKHTSIRHNVHLDLASLSREEFHQAVQLQSMDMITISLEQTASDKGHSDALNSQISNWNGSTKSHIDDEDSRPDTDPRISKHASAAARWKKHDVDLSSSERNASSRIKMHNCLPSLNPVTKSTRHQIDPKHTLGRHELSASKPLPAFDHRRTRHDFTADEVKSLLDGVAR
jgi:hypothetical protein